MKAKIVTSHQETLRIEIEDGDDTMSIWLTEDGNLAFRQQSVTKDMKIIPKTSNCFELEFVKRKGDNIRRK